MSHLLPPSGSPLRDCFDVEDLVAIGTKQRQAPLLKEAKIYARDYFRTADKAVNRLYFIAMVANDDLWLISIGPRGGVQYHWNFSR